MKDSGHHTRVGNTLQTQVADGTSVDLERDRGTTWQWTRYLDVPGVVEQDPLLVKQRKTTVGDAAE